MFFKKKKRETTPPPAPAPLASEEGSQGSTQFITGQANLDQRNVQVLLDAIARVNESRDLESLLLYIVDTAIEVTGAERGMLIFQSSSGDLSVRVARLAGEKFPAEDVRFSTSVVRKVIVEQAPLRSIDSEAEEMQLGTSVFDLKLRAMMCVPLQGSLIDQASNNERGVLYVDSKVASREFQDEDLALFEALSQQMNIALENARLHIESLEKARLQNEMDTASLIQSGLMRQIPQDLPGLDVYGWYRSAEGTSGDFYDFVKMRDGYLAVIVGDVTGHGIGPALITTSAQAGLRSSLRMVNEPGRALTMLNEDLIESVEDGLFLTLFLAVIAPDGSMQAINAGHTPPMIWRAATGEIERINGHGPALGMMDDFEYSELSELKLEPGDQLLAITDGLSEARRLDKPDDMFGEDGVARILTQEAGRCGSAREFTETLVRAALEFSNGEQEDDMTVVTVRRTATE